MLVKLNEGNEHQAINTDYIINLYCKLHETKWKVLARMIDGSILSLTEHLGEETAKKEYERILKEANMPR